MLCVVCGIGLIVLDSLPLMSTICLATCFVFPVTPLGFDLEKKKHLISPCNPCTVDHL